MKKTLFLVLSLFLASSTMLMAQEVKFGLKGGVSLHQITIEDEEDFSSSTDHRLGFAGGLFVQIPLRPNLSLQPELLIALKGSKEEINLKFDIFDVLYEFEGKYKSRFTYIDLPVLLRYDIDTKHSYRPYVFGGPFAGYLIGGTIENSFVAREDGVITEEENEKLKATDVLESFNYGILLGGGVQYDSFSFDLRYELGLANIQSDSNDENTKLKIRGLTLTVGYRF